MKIYFPFYAGTNANTTQLIEHWQHCGGKIEDGRYIIGDDNIVAEFILTFTGNFDIIWFDGMIQDDYTTQKI